VPIVLKSGSLNLLEPSGPVQAYNGTALPLPTKPYLYFQFSSPLFPATLPFNLILLKCPPQTAVCFGESKA